MTTLIQPETLPGAWEELTMIQAKVPDQWLITLGDTVPVTRERALLHLGDSSIVHFACHGTQDPVNPLDSGLELTDGQLKVPAVMKVKGDSTQ
jgi:CHAT domain-containing protein